MIVLQLNGVVFNSRFSHLNFRFRACLEQEVLAIQATIKCGFPLKLVREIIIRDSQIHHRVKYSQHSFLIWPGWLNFLEIVFELNGVVFESHYSDRNFRFLVF